MSDKQAEPTLSSVVVEDSEPTVVVFNYEPESALTLALRLCREWRAMLPDGSRMNQAQLFNLLAPRIAKALDARYTAGLQRAAEIAENEKLRDSVNDRGDAAYNQAIKDVVEAIRKEIK